MSDSWFDSKLPGVEQIRRRLGLIIPVGQDPQGWARRELAAKTVFVMLYGDALEGRDRWVRPTAVADMTDAQATQQDPKIRRQWLDSVQGRNRPRNVAGRWYSENTRESIRDETLRTFLELGIVVERPGLATTSPLPRYALATEFTALLSPQLSEEELTAAIASWQEGHLSAAARARLTITRKGAGTRGERVLVRLPNGETRRLAVGPSSVLTRAAIEEFAPRFLKEPAAIMISESAKKLRFKDEELLRSLGIEIDVSGALPDAILADLGCKPPMLVFVECVVTDGPITERRKQDLENLALKGGFRPADCAYVTAFHDRAESPYRKVTASLAWGTFVWFKSEPDHIVFLRGGAEQHTTSLASLLRTG